MVMRMEAEIVKRFERLESYDCPYCGVLDALFFRAAEAKNIGKMRELLEKKEKHVAEHRERGEIPLFEGG